MSWHKNVLRLLWEYIVYILNNDYCLQQKVGKDE